MTQKFHSYLKVETNIQTDPSTHMFTAALFTIGERAKRLKKKKKDSNIHESMTKQIMICTLSRILLSHTNE